MKSLCILEKISMIDVLSKLTHEGVFRKLAFCIEPLIKRFICYLNLATLPPYDVLQYCAGLWPCSSDSNLVLLLCVLASNVHSYQN